MVSCGRGCVGVSISDAQNICSIPITHDCGVGCANLAIGQSRVQVNADGTLEVCSNVGGVCECSEVCIECINNVVSANTCEDGGVGDDYLVRQFDIVGNTLTINSAYRHQNFIFSRNATLANVGHTNGIGVQQEHGEVSGNLTYSDCRETRVSVELNAQMFVQVPANTEIEYRIFLTRNGVDFVGSGATWRPAVLPSNADYNFSIDFPVAFAIPAGSPDDLWGMKLTSDLFAGNPTTATAFLNMVVTSLTTG